MRCCPHACCSMWHLPTRSASHPFRGKVREAQTVPNAHHKSASYAPLRCGEPHDASTAESIRPNAANNAMTRRLHQSIKCAPEPGRLCSSASAMGARVQSGVRSNSRPAPPRVESNTGRWLARPFEGGGVGGFPVQCKDECRRAMRRNERLDCPFQACTHPKTTEHIIVVPPSRSPTQQ